MGTATKTHLEPSGVQTRCFLEQSVQFLSGVGPARLKHWSHLGVHTVRDLLFYFPFRHELIPRSIPIGSLTEGIVATLVGTVQRMRSYGPAGKKTVYAELVDGTGRCRLRWFHSDYLIDRIRPGTLLRVTGTVEVRAGLAGLTNPAMQPVDPKEPLAGDRDRWEPVYPASSQLSSRQIARAVANILERGTAALADMLPEALRAKRRLVPLAVAVGRFHRPETTTDVQLARRRLAYDELLLSQLAVQIARRLRMTRALAPPVMVDARLDDRIRRRIPFVLTAGQNRAVGEIRGDLAGTVPMNRLLQGDVGCGKTAVAVYAALAVIARGHQVVLLAPTEVLARQHEAKVAAYLKGSRVRVAFLSGSTARAQRAKILTALGEGKLDLLLGTHAVLEKGVEFSDLALAIIDEQQKFGVAQRLALRIKGSSPHVLVLSATPIPRTLAMTLLGDLDISTIRGAPPGRKPVRTRLVDSQQADRAWEFVRTQLARGRQAYVVYPLVEESEALDLRAATKEVQVLQTTHLGGHTLGLLHGKMKPAEKDEVMARFRAGRTAVLVSTVVIEVGVDVANATLMIVQHADRFGLSQLHQLRGRVGRGGHESHCLLFTDTASETARERLRILCATGDGFTIAEEDLRLRGPGELLGTRQHGMPEFRVADLVRDTELIQLARNDAEQLLREDPRLTHPHQRLLRQALLKRYGPVLQFLQVA